MLKVQDIVFVVTLEEETPMGFDFGCHGGGGIHH